MARFQQEKKQQTGDVWVVNQDGRVVCVNDGSAQHEYAMTGNQGWRLATPEQIKEAQSKAGEDSKKYSAMAEAEKSARYARRRGPMAESAEPVIVKKETFKR